MTIAAMRVKTPPGLVSFSLVLVRIVVSPIDKDDDYDDDDTQFARPQQPPNRGALAAATAIGRHPPTTTEPAAAERQPKFSFTPLFACNWLHPGRDSRSLVRPLGGVQGGKVAATTGGYRSE